MLNIKIKFKLIVLLFICLSLINIASGEWIYDSEVGDAGTFSSPSVFNDSGTIKMISGITDGTFAGYKLTGTTWSIDSSVAAGLGDVGVFSTITVFYRYGAWKAITGEEDGVFTGFDWNGTSWVYNASVAAGLGDVGTWSNPSVYNDAGTWKLISGNGDGVWHGWIWDGTSWIISATLINGLLDVGQYSAPTVYTEDGTWKLITGRRSGGTYSGYYRNATSWTLDADIIDGLTNVIEASDPSVYYEDGELKIIVGDKYGRLTYFYQNVTAAPTPTPTPTPTEEATIPIIIAIYPSFPSIDETPGVPPELEDEIMPSNIQKFVGDLVEGMQAGIEDIIEDIENLVEPIQSTYEEITRTTETSSFLFILFAYFGALVASLLLFYTAENEIDIPTILLSGTIGWMIPLVITFIGIISLVFASGILTGLVFAVFGFVIHVLMDGLSSE